MIPPCFSISVHERQGLDEESLEDDSSPWCWWLRKTCYYWREKEFWFLNPELYLIEAECFPSLLRHLWHEKPDCCCLTFFLKTELSLAIGKQQLNHCNSFIPIYELSDFVDFINLVWKICLKDFPNYLHLSQLLLHTWTNMALCNINVTDKLFQDCFVETTVVAVDGVEGDTR